VIADYAIGPSSAETYGDDEDDSEDGDSESEESTSDGTFSFGE